MSELDFAVERDPSSASEHEMSKALWFTLALVGLAGCGQARVRVLDDLTDKPVAGVQVVPHADNILVIPYAGKPVVTDGDGRATLSYNGGLYGIDAIYPSLVQVFPGDKPWSTTQAYLRLPPRIVLLLPADFTGPVVLSGRSGQMEREPVYRLPLPADPFQPLQVPGLNDGLITHENIEAECGGMRIRAAPASADAQAVFVWELNEGRGLFYEDDYVQLVYVGTSDGFRGFDFALCAYLTHQGVAKHIDREHLASLTARTAKTNTKH